MSCTFAAFLACFHLSGFYVDAALIHSNMGEARLVESTVISQQKSFIGGVETIPINHVTRTLETSPQNPYARLAIGYDVQWSAKWSTRIDFSEARSIATGSGHSDQRIAFDVQWRPFGN